MKDKNSSVKIWKMPSIEEVSSREPLEPAIAIAKSLARQAARIDHEVGLLTEMKGKNEPETGAHSLDDN